MSLQNEMRVIPPVAKALAVLAYLGVAIGLIAILIPQSHNTSMMPKGGQIALGMFAAAVPAIYVLLVGYIYGDARRRRMRYIVWTLLTIFVPQAIGIILYFILRDPLPVFCPHCGASVKAAFTFCPQCAAALRPTCLQCKRPVEHTWSHCPNCGAVTSTATQATASAAAPDPRALEGKKPSFSG